MIGELLFGLVGASFILYIVYRFYREYTDKGPIPYRKGPSY